MPVLTVEKPLRERLGDDGADSLIRLLNQSLNEQKNDVLKFVEEKFERRLSEEISNLEIRLTEKISESRADMIKWMFIFWVGQIGVMIGILYVFFK